MKAKAKGDVVFAVAVCVRQVRPCQGKSELKVTILIRVINNDAYEFMVNPCTPVKPPDKTYTELVPDYKTIGR